MANFFSPRKLKHFFSFNRRRSKGFTLLELLVAMIIGSLIVIALLTLVVQLTETNQKDAARSQVQQDMQVATDFIAQELREAVFVYNGECLKGNGPPTDAATLKTNCPGIVNHIPATMSSGTRTPVLAFWRTKKLPAAIAGSSSSLCGTNADGLSKPQPPPPAPPHPLVAAGVPCLAGYTYSLVVYAIDTGNPGNIWSGNARLIRYELNQFEEGATTAAQQNMGYVNPLQDPKYRFQQWPYDSNGKDRQQLSAQVKGRPNGSSAVLVDFLDSKTATNINCDEFGVDTPSRTNALTPSATASPRGFYACVRGGGMGTSAIAGQNQDVLLVMKGNVSGQSGFDKKFDNDERISPLQTRVLIRGVVDKP